MPENNNLDILIQQKMEEFRLEPSPADWQAIYDRLHPKKDRRFIWWWIPLAAGLLFGGYWYITQYRSQLQTKTAVADLPVTNAASEKNNIPADAMQYQAKPTPGSSGPGSPTSKQKGDSPRPASVLPQDGITENRTTDQTATDRTKKSLRPKSNNVDKSREKNSPAWPASSKTTTTAEISGISESSTIPKLIEEPQIQSTPVQPNSTAQIHEETLKGPTADTLSKVSQPKDTLSLSEVSPSAVKKSSIPNLTDHSAKGWYLGAYAELGSNKPTEPVSMTKAADLNSSPNSSSNTTTYEGSGNNGLHWSAGLALERKMKKMSFSFGLGIQHNAWSSSGTTYKDSLVNGSFYSRTLISNNSTSYTHTALEIPFLLNFRIAGKKNSSFWINTGLNNTITLNLNQNTDVSMTQSAGNFTLDNSLSSRASIYQPQFRLGLTYENAQKKYHWQLSPFMQYGLNGMVKTGSPDIHMLHLGVQTRYYFKKLK